MLLYAGEDACAPRGFALPQYTTFFIIYVSREREIFRKKLGWGKATKLRKTLEAPGSGATFLHLTVGRPSDVKVYICRELQRGHNARGTWVRL